MSEPLCAVNIGRRERRGRLVLGAVALAVGAAGAALFLTRPPDSFWIYFTVAIPYYAGCLGLLQGLTGT